MLDNVAVSSYVEGEVHEQDVLRRGSLRRGGHFEYRHTRAMDMPSAMPRCMYIMSKVRCMSCRKTFLEEALEGEADADEVEDEDGRMPDNCIWLWRM